MKIFIGADHRGVRLKRDVIDILNDLKHEVLDCGAFDDTKSCDYPLIAFDVSKKVAADKSSRGVLICMSGIGQAMTANKVKGAYAALCYNKEAAELSRQHNNANVLVLGAKFIKIEELRDIVEMFFNTEFEGGRHEKRIDLIKQIENDTLG